MKILNNYDYYLIKIKFGNYAILLIVLLILVLKDIYILINLHFQTIVQTNFYNLI